MELKGLYSPPAYQWSLSITCNGLRIRLKLRAESLETTIWDAEFLPKYKERYGVLAKVCKKPIGLWSICSELARHVPHANLQIKRTYCTHNPTAFISGWVTAAEGFSYNAGWCSLKGKRRRSMRQAKRWAREQVRKGGEVKCVMEALWLTRCITLQWGDELWEENGSQKGISSPFVPQVGPSSWYWRYICSVSWGQSPEAVQLDLCLSMQEDSALFK